MKPARMIMGQQNKDFLFITSIFLISIFVIFALFPHVFAGGPLTIYLPGILGDGEVKIFTYTPPVHFSGEDMDLKNILQPPFKSINHYLGTDQLGRDVLAGIIHGCRTSFLISLPSMLLATLLGLALGSIAGFFGDNKLLTCYATVIAYGFAIFLAFFYGFYIRQVQFQNAMNSGVVAGFVELLISLAIFFLVFACGYFIKMLLGIMPVLKKKIKVPADQIVLKLIELLTSIPRLILIISLASFVKPSIFILILLIGFTYWTEIARLTRGELLKIKALNYIESGKALGLTELRLLIRHALPNALPSVIVAFTFGLAQLLALEATLSFLGIGLPPDYISWGKMIAGIRFNLAAWWLAVFPGLYLCLMVLAFQICSHYLMKKLNPKIS